MPLNEDGTVTDPAADVKGVAEETAQAALTTAVDSLSRRGYAQTENYVLLIGTLMTTVLAKTGVSGSLAVQIVTIAAPMAVAALVAGLRTIQKKALAELAAKLHGSNSSPW